MAWKLCGWGEEVIYNYKDLDKTKIYGLMASTVVPRPIAWIVTEGKDKVINIAPFSYFIPLSSNPPIMIVSIGHKEDKTPKDTLKNIRETKKCTICIPNVEDKDLVQESSKSFEYGVSEAKELDIKTKTMQDGFPPMMANSKVAFFCELYEELKIKKSQTIPLIVEVKAQYVDDSIITDEGIDFLPLGRVAKDYAELKKI